MPKKRKSGPQSPAAPRTQLARDAALAYEQRIPLDGIPGAYLPPAWFFERHGRTAESTAALSAVGRRMGGAEARARAFAGRFTR